MRWKSLSLVGTICVGDRGCRGRRGPRADVAFRSKSEQVTVELGRVIGRSLRKGDAVYLSGELGAGKTRMAQGIAEGAGTDESARSPTFVILHQYPGAVSLFHCDLYRISGAAEVDELALEECLDAGALIVEWPERSEGALPPDALLVTFAKGEGPDIRELRLVPGGPKSADLLARAAAGLKSATGRPETHG